MRHGQDVPATPPFVFGAEWLLTDGLGGSASGTASGASPRRTHALLVASADQGRLVTLLLGIEERLMTARGSWDLMPRVGGSAPGARQGIVESFIRLPVPTWRLRAGEVVLEKRVALIHGHAAVRVSYRRVSGPQAHLTLGPRIVCRAPDEMQVEDARVRGAAQGIPGRVRIELLPQERAITLWHNGAFLPARVWRRGLGHPLDDTECVNGDACALESALIPGWIEGDLGAREGLHMVASAEDDLFRRLATEERLGTPPPRSLAGCIEQLEREALGREVTRARRVTVGADFTARQAATAHNSPLARRRDALVGARDPWVAPLGAALDAALRRRGGRLEILSALPVHAPLAGQPLRALGALITLRWFDEAREILRGAVEYLDEGLAPERFDPVDGTPHYGDPEPALWLVAAADLYARRSDDVDFLRETLYPPLEGVMQFYRAGTRGVRVGSVGLLETSMGGVVTARADLNALWYHALVAMAQMARLVGRRENGAFYLAWAREQRQRFAELLWDEAEGRLYSRLEDGVPVRGIEPAHALAVSLQPAALAPDRARRQVESLERELFTPWGLREAPLSSVALTAWLGPFYVAYVRAHQREAGALSRVHDWLEVLRGSLSTPTFAGIPTVFHLGEGAPRPAGTFSTAAAGALLTAWVEELDPTAAPAPRTDEPAPLLV